MEFMITSSKKHRFIVQNTFRAKLQICPCKSNHEMNIVLPCGHPKCPKASIPGKKCQCGKEITFIGKLIDIYAIFD